MRPSTTKLYSSSRVWRWSGAASVRGGMGCSTIETVPPVSSPQAMNRTPIVISGPARPSSGPSTRASFGITASSDLRNAIMRARVATRKEALRGARRLRQA